MIVMKDIVKITLKGSSCFGLSIDAYTDKVTITQDKISYLYRPMIESEYNPVRKWSYSTNSPNFKKTYAEICEEVQFLHNRYSTIPCEDYMGIEAKITFSDKRIEHATYYDLTSDSELIKLIRNLVPDYEIMPNVLG